MGTTRTEPRTRSAWPCSTWATTTTSSGTTSPATTRSPPFASSLELQNRTNRSNKILIFSTQRSGVWGEPNLSLLAKSIIDIKCCFTYNLSIRRMYNTNRKLQCEKKKCGGKKKKKKKKKK